MKTIISLILICLASFTHGQLSLSEIGIPDEMMTYANTVIQSQEINQPEVVPVTSSNGTRTYMVRWKKQRPGFTGYALNFIHGYVHDFDHTYRGMVGGWHHFKKDGFNFTASGQTYTIDPQNLYIKKEGNNTTFKLVTEVSSYRMLVGRAWMNYTADELAALGKITKQVLWERDADYWYATERNPATHITSVFVTVNGTAGNYNAQTYVNLQPATSYGGRITSYNKSGISYVVRWKLYNGCTAATAISGGYEKGNFGLCELRGPLAMGAERNTVSFFVDPSKEWGVVECQIEELPAQGKNFTTSGYFTVHGCDEDDPCGPSRRLVRVPAR